MARVLVAMSGGVDSSVAAALLAGQGHEVVGVTMKLWGGDSDSGCCSISDVDDARRVAHELDIDHHVFNFGEEFDAHVVSPYLESHLAGDTPNPCIECNRHLKFDVLLHRAEVLGFDTVATGHHARRVTVNGDERLARGADAAKDQSYVLYTLRGAALERTLLPLGSMTKTEVREIAAKLGLRTARKPDSQDVCFITQAEGRVSFLRRHIPLRPATVVDTEGVVLGEVAAAETLTIGQRRGLDIGGGSGPRYVVDVDLGAQRVVLGEAADLLVSETALTQLVWAGEPVVGEVLAQCSAHGSADPATLLPDGTVRWTQPHRRVAPGQSVVFYEGDTVVGGGIALRA